jgi:hypothetical protein
VVRVAGRQSKVVPADEPWGDPETSSVKYAGEAHLLKPATDIVVVGTGHAPREKPASTFGVSLTVGKVKRKVQVFGGREWKGAVSLGPSSPAPAVTVPLVWERAYGGKHEREDGTLLAEERNPVGCGFAGKRTSSEMRGQPVPNLEDPQDLIGGLSDRPAPVGFGFVSPGWLPRRKYAGTYGAAWQETRAPYLPDDFDPRFLQAAPPELIYPGRVRGGEPVELVNLGVGERRTFALPACELDVSLRIAGRTEPLRMELETVLLEPDASQLSLTWRGGAPVDKEQLRLELAQIRLRSLAGVAK